MISRFFTKTFTVSRQEWSNESSAEVVKSSFLGHIQSMKSDEAEAQLGIAMTNAFKLWCPIDTNLMKGDRLVGPDGKIYHVEFIKEWDMGTNQHLEVMVQLDLSEPISV